MNATAPQTDDPVAAFRLDSYAQEGEDLVLRRFFEGQTCGFYIDVGAYHPFQHSNTFHFYLRGWRGINIDAMPLSMDEFNRHRPRDINLELAVSTVPKMTYYIFNQPALNGFDEEISLCRDNNAHGDKILYRVELKTVTLAWILEKHLPPGQAIDFLSIDAEGHDLEVLRSNDWKRFRPRMVLAEELRRQPLDNMENAPLLCFMRGNGYRPCARTFNTLFFEREH